MNKKFTHLEALREDAPFFNRRTTQCIREAFAGKHLMEASLPSASKKRETLP